MRPGIQRPRVLHLTEIDVEREPAPDIARCCTRAYASEQISNRFGIAQGTKNGLDSCGRERRKEIPQVHPQHNALAHVGSDKRLDGSPFDKPMHPGMGWDSFKYLGQNLPLQFLQARLRRFNQANVAGLLRQYPVVVVPQLGANALIPESLEVGEPLQFDCPESKPVG